MDIANLEKKQYLCTVEYFVADILGWNITTARRLNNTQR